MLRAAGAAPVVDEAVLVGDAEVAAGAVEEAPPLALETNADAAPPETPAACNNDVKSNEHILFETLFVNSVFLKIEFVIISMIGATR